MKTPYLLGVCTACMLASSLAPAQDLPENPSDPLLQAPQDAPTESSGPAVVEDNEDGTVEPLGQLSASELAQLEANELAQLEESLQADESPPLPATSSGISNSNPDIAVILDVAGSYFSDEPLMTGAHDPNHTGVTLQQLEMHIASSVDPYFTFDANLVFAQFGVEVEEAYFRTLALPANLQVKGGQFLTAFGRLNATHPHSWSFLSQPISNGKFFGGEGSRGLGAQVSWITPLPWYSEVVASGTEAVGECCARSFFGGEDLGIKSPSDLLYTTAIKQFFPVSDDFSVMWGISAQFGPNPSGNGNRSEIYGTDLYLRYRPINGTEHEAVSFQIEGMARKRQVPGDVLNDFGGYADLVWRMNKRWETGARGEYVTGIEGDPLDPEWTDDRVRASLQATFYPSHFSRLRLQALADRPDQDRWYWGAMLGVEVLVGAHGAHAY